MKFNQHLEYALHTWAINEQGALNLGYPSTAAGFSEYRAGYRTSSKVPSERELDILRLVERGIGRIRLWPDRKPIKVLTQMYGAYLDAPPKKERLEKLYKDMSKRDSYRHLDSAKLYLQGVIDEHMEVASFAIASAQK